MAGTEPGFGQWTWIFFDHYTIRRIKNTYAIYKVNECNILLLLNSTFI